MSEPRTLRYLPLALLLVALAAPAAAASFPPVSDAEKAMTEVPGSPGAAAVVLASKAEFWMMDIRNQRMNSTIEVWRRVKVLTAEGAEEYGEIVLPHSRRVRLGKLEGRTVLPDGREVPLAKDAVFRRRSSRLEREFVTAVAFPAVEEGAILDLRYEIRFDSMLYLEPWFFQSEIPTLHAEITYHVPDTVEVGTWGFAPASLQFQQDVQNEKDGRRVKVWMDNLPAVPDEPFGWPMEDISAKYMLIPKTIYYPGQAVPLMSTWKDVCGLIDDFYKEAGLKSGKIKAKSAEIAAGAQGPRAVAQALYRFVRDEVSTTAGYAIFPGEGSKLDKVLAEGQGSAAQKALLLHALLEAAKIDSSPVWVPDRWDGKIDPQVPNPGWFDTMMVQVRFASGGGEEVAYLDPSDPSLGFGFLAPRHEGVTAVVHDRKDPQVVAVPETPYESNRRRAALDLAIDEEGRLAGSGELELTGHHAWVRLLTEDTPEATTSAWEEWLHDRLPGYELAEVAVDESVEERRVGVTWSMHQLDEEVLGDEASVQLSRPLGPITQLFQLAPERRKTPVLLSFGDVDEVRVELVWPSGWELETAPKDLERRTSLGIAAAKLAVDEEAGSLTYERRLEVHRRELTNSEEYRALRSLFAVMEAHDAQALVLVAP